MKLVSKDVTRRGLLLAMVTMPLIPGARPGTAATNAIFLPTPTNAEAVTIALGAAGSVHAAYISLDLATPGAQYAFCAANCGAAANWSILPVGVVGLFGGGVRLALTPDGRPRMMWLRDSGGVSNTYEYAECNAADCRDIANWTQGTVATRVSGSYSRHTRYFALDPQGRPRFLYNDGATGGGTFYYFCDTAPCTVAANWQQTKIDDANLDMYSLVFDAQSRPRLAWADLNGSPGVMGYSTCDSNCDSSANWTSTPLYLLGSGGAIALRLDSSGRPRIAFYQGSRPGQAGDRLLAYAWCDTGCTMATNWSANNPGFPQEHGQDVDLVLDANQRPRLAYYANADPFSAVYAQCTANCESVSAAPTWDGIFVETSAELQARSPVPVQPGCSISVWFPGERPSLVLDAAENPLFGYDARHTQGGSCSVRDDIKLLRFATLTGGSPPPSVSISIGDAAVIEGNSGPANLVFPVSLSAASSSTVTVSYATAAQTATAGVDYTAASGSLTFNPGVTSLTVTVPAIGDGAVEANETFLVNLSGAANATIADSEGVGTIIDDDTPITDPATVYRLRHPSIGAYLFTVYPHERDSAQLQYGYIYEGVCCKWYVSPAGDGRMPLYRLFSSAAGEYFFTIYASERDAAVAQFGYVYEGVAAYGHPNSTPAAPRDWYRLRLGNKHIYTIYPEERDSAVSQFGFIYEGVSCFLPPP